MFLVTNINVYNNKEIPSGVLLPRIKQTVLDSNNKLYWTLVSLIHSDSNVYLANLLLLNNKDITKQIELMFPQINKAEVTKNYYNHTLLVNIEEKHPVLAVKINNVDINNLYIDQNGILFKADTVDKSKLPEIIFFDFVDENLLNKSIVHREIFSKSQMDTILTLLNYRENFQLGINHFEYTFRKPNSLVLQTKFNFMIYLSLRPDIVDSLKAAEVYYLKIIKPKNKNIEYIDVRYYPEKLFYK
jgi:hypothetical protein